MGGKFNSKTHLLHTFFWRRLLRVLLQSLFKVFLDILFAQEKAQKTETFFLKHVLEFHYAIINRLVQPRF
jgi:hypothetical protein